MAKKKPTKRKRVEPKPHWLNQNGDTTVERVKGVTVICDALNEVLISPSELRELYDWIKVNGFGDKPRA